MSSPGLNALQVTLIGCCVLLTMVGLTYIFARCKPVYLLDYHCYKPPDRQVIPLFDTFCSQVMKPTTQLCSDGLSAAAPPEHPVLSEESRLTCIIMCRFKMPHQKFLELSRNCGVSI